MVFTDLILLLTVHFERIAKSGKGIGNREEEELENCSY